MRLLVAQESTAGKRFRICTWNTVRQLCGNVSKWLLDSIASVNLPPKICIPSREKMKMKRNKMTSRELMDAIELTSDLTRLPIEAQYLQKHGNNMVV